jgi:hypothetical protein
MAILMQHRSGSRSRLLVVVGLAATLIAGCGQSGAKPSAPPASTLTAVAATPSGPVAFAEWTARQGFGGSSGLANMNKLAKWLDAHRGDATPFDLTSDSHDIDGLIAWLDQHPASSCWADYHAAMRALLAKLQGPYATAIQARTDGAAVTIGTSLQIVAGAQAAVDLPAPAGCP